MEKVIDNAMKEFFDYELKKVILEKERIHEEKQRAWTKIFELLNIEGSIDNHEEKSRFEFLHRYNVILTQQYELLCTRHITLIKSITG